MIFIIIYIYMNLYLCIYTPLYPHFKAFPVSKFNSETSFLYQLFKENSNIIVFYNFQNYLCLFESLFMHIYTPSYPHFKAFPVSKFNLETSFLYQLFKENSNIIVLKPCKLINEAIFWFSLLFIFIHIFIYAFIPLF